MTEKFRAYVAAYLVLEKGGQTLLLRRFNTGYQDGNYSLVAGHLDGQETAEQCIIREAEEEAGIELRPDDLDVVHVMHRLSPDREYFDIYVRAKVCGGEITNKEPNKCDDLRWFPSEDLPLNILPEVKCALENINQSVHYSEIGWN